MTPNTDNVNADLLNRFRAFVADASEKRAQDLLPEDWSRPVTVREMDAALAENGWDEFDRGCLEDVRAHLVLCSQLLELDLSIEGVEWMMEERTIVQRGIADAEWEFWLREHAEEIEAMRARQAAVRAHTTDRERLERVAELGDDVASTATRLDTRAGLVSLTSQVRTLIDDERIEVYTVQNSIKWRDRGEVVCVVVGPHSPVRNHELFQQAEEAARQLGLSSERETDEYSTACYLWAQQ